MTLPAPIIPNSEVSLIDERAEQLGVSIEHLMEQAGSAVAAYVHTHYPQANILIACGSGNNGGDGYVAARLLAERSHHVRVWPVSPAKSTLCKQQFESLPASIDIIQSADEIGNADIIVDAILGAGAVGTLREPVKQALQALQKIQCPCVAVDIATGFASEYALNNCHTLSFQLAKESLNEDFDIIDIGIPSAAYSECSDVIFRKFPRHHLQSHKGNNGSVFVLAGWQFPGARDFCSRAALLSGCDLVHCWVDEHSQIDSACVRHNAQQSDLSNLIERCDVLLLGPGMGRKHDQLIHSCFQIANDYQKPCVIDADAIHHLKYKLQKKQCPPVIITPHAAELHALLGVRSPTEEQIHAHAHKHKVILAKGAIDFISNGKQWQRNHSGNPRMAVGGSGDILAGLAAGLVARGCSLFDAARIAVYWECTSADACWRALGPSYLPQDILQELPQTLKSTLSEQNNWPPLY